MRRRYFGIHTIWYSVLYALCPDNLVSTHLLYNIAAASFTHGQARGTLPLRGQLESSVETSSLFAQKIVIGYAAS